MTEEQWRACDSPARMRGQMRERPHSALRWLRFNLACVQRVRDLLTPAANQFVNEYAGWDGVTARDWGAVARQIDAIHAEIPSLWRQRSDPLNGAKVAAARAVLTVRAITLATSEMVCVAAGRRVGRDGLAEAVIAERQAHAALVRCVFGSTFATVTFDPAWRTDTVVALANQACALRDYSALPILADALQEAGCDDDHILSHCRCGGPHVRGCWALDLVLGRERP